MSRVPRDLVLLTALALAARVVAALLVTSPPYVDAAYYTLVGERLATGDGFSIPVLWSFLEVGARLPAHPVLPVPSNAHWMPLTSIVAAGSMALFGPSWRAAEVPMVLLSTALVPLTYLVGWEVWASRRVAVVSGLLAVFSGPLLMMYPLVENFAVFGVVGAAALYASLRAMRSPRPGRWLVLSGALVGLATLARIDGLLLAVAPALAWVLRWRDRRVGVGPLVLAALAGVAVLAPWVARDVAVLGTPLPSAGGHTLWITSYNEQFSIGHQVDLASYLAWGLPSIIGSKLASWGELLGRTLALTGGIFGLFFLAGLWTERRRRELLPVIAYWLVMFATMGLVFTFHAPKGAFSHSAPAWLPFALPLAVAAMPGVSSAIGRWWPFLRRARTHAFLVWVGLAGALVLSIAGSATLLVTWRTDTQRYAAAAAFLDSSTAPGDRVMALDPSRLYLLSGRQGIAPPFDPYPVVARTISVYDIRWVVVTLEPGETRDPLGFWDGAAAVDADGNHATFLAAAPAFEAPGVRIYAVAPQP